MTKYIFVTGGVVSGLGKGITAASLGRLLKCRGYKVASQKQARTRRAPVREHTESTQSSAHGILRRIATRKHILQGEE